jgi:[acyl-carrier-protein] S-malonyltransferase
MARLSRRPPRRGQRLQVQVMAEAEAVAEVQAPCQAHPAAEEVAAVAPKSRPRHPFTAIDFSGAAEGNPCRGGSKQPNPAPRLRPIHFLMSHKISLVFPGQGAQAVGMGRELAAEFSVAADLFRQADEILGWPLSKICWEGPEEELTKTSVCQPALFVHGLAALAVVREKFGDLPITAAAGLSLGEFTAHAAAGTYDFATGLRLVAQRGRFMQDACEATLGGMAAMIGAEESVVRDLAAQTDVDVANINSPGQIVISGEAGKVAVAVGLAKDFGIRKAVELKVAGAFHSRLMQPAYEQLGEVLLATALHEPKFPVVCNVDAKPVRAADDIRRTLADQVTDSVRWADCVTCLLDELRCDTFLELGQGKTLAGMIARIRKGTMVRSVGEPGDLAELALA